MLTNVAARTWKETYPRHFLHCLVATLVEILLRILAILEARQILWENLQAILKTRAFLAILEGLLLGPRQAILLVILGRLATRLDLQQHKNTHIFICLQYQKLMSMHSYTCTFRLKISA
jgi:hypothetical protein